MIVESAIKMLQFSLFEEVLIGVNLKFGVNPSSMRKAERNVAAVSN